MEGLIGDERDDGSESAAFYLLTSGMGLFGFWNLSGGVSN